MVAKRIRRTPKAKPKNQRVPVRFKSIAKSRFEESLDEHRTRFELQLEALRPQIEHARAVNSKNAAAMRRYETFERQAVERRQRGLMARRGAGGSKAAWPLGHDAGGIPYFPVGPSRAASIPYRTPPRVLTIQPLDYARLDVPPSKDGDGTGNYNPVDPPEFYVGGDFKVTSNGSVCGAQSIGVSFLSADSGSTFANIRSRARGWVTVMSLQGIATAEVTVESLVAEEQGPILATSGVQVLCSASAMSAGNFPISSPSGLELVFDRQPNKRYWIWHEFFYFAAAEAGLASLSVEGGFVTPLEIWLYD